MKVSDLLDALGGVDEEAEVRIAFQPAYPLEYEVGNIVDVLDSKDGLVVYLAEGDLIGYLNSDAVREIGWRN